MSNALAIAAVTATLRHLLQKGIPALDKGLGDVQVTAQPLDRARTGITSAQVNLFLYQTVLNGAWRNTDNPRQVQPGDTGHPPLPLNLYYVLTTYGRADNDSDALSHEVLGAAMSVLHDHPVLGTAEINSALPDSGLDTQIERVRITPQPMSIDELSKLWTAFQTNYRISAAYEATVVLIDSTRPTRTPLPVLTRGQGDRGVLSQPDLIPPFPALYELAISKKQPSARLNDQLTVKGIHLDGSNVGVAFNQARWAKPFEQAPDAGGTGTQVVVTIPNQPTWPAGFYTLAVLVQRPGESYRRSTNELPFSLAPSIRTIAPKTASVGNITFTVTCSPQIQLQQRVVLLLGNVEILAEPRQVATDTLTFKAMAVASGTYWVRLRVDGVDSLLVVDRTATPPTFDPNLKVTVT